MAGLDSVCKGRKSIMLTAYVFKNVGGMPALYQLKPPFEMDGELRYTVFSPDSGLLYLITTKTNK
jgi:hypothetical protein